VTPGQVSRVTVFSSYEIQKFSCISLVCWTAGHVEYFWLREENERDICLSCCCCNSCYYDAVYRIRKRKADKNRSLLGVCILLSHNFFFVGWFVRFFLFVGVSWAFAKGAMARLKAINKSSVSPKQQALKIV
jgi:hypothetical protein